MALAFNKILVAGANSNTTGAYFQTTTLSVTTGAGNVIPAGTYLMFPTGNVTIIANNGTGFSTVIGNNTGGFVISDGQNVYANSLGSTQTLTLLTVNGGLAATGTFNS